MTQLAAVPLEESRPYHHGDLRRALCDAARTILERDGIAALSLRAVAREAGVSPAAPYHHFKDKSDLLDAVAGLGWDELGAAVAAARDAAPEPRKLVAIGAAYVTFARANPAIYRVMYDRARDQTALPDKLHDGEDTAYVAVRDCVSQTRIAAGLDTEDVDPQEVELAVIAAWCMAHGLAEMASFKQFEPLKAAVGGEQRFLEEVLSHIGPFRPHG